MILSEVSRGIIHIEDLPINKFVSVVKNLSSYEITEKVDGAQILFGIDEQGFYTSRETKGGTRVYNQSDYGLKFSETYMRSAHIVLESVLPLLKSAGLRSGCQAEAEVLYGELPNVVPYSVDRNHIIFLRTTEGMLDIGRLTEQLKDTLINASVMAPYTPDGKSIKLQEESHNWGFSGPAIIPGNSMSLQKAVNRKLTELMLYLKAPSGVRHFSNIVIESIPLNKCPDWCNQSEWKFVKEAIKIKKAEIHKHVNEGLMLDIKTILVERLLKRGSQFGPLLEDGGWIEGVVLRNTATGQMTKVVDKCIFLAVKDFSWKVRNDLRESAKSPETANSFIGKMLVDMATAIGHPVLGTIHAKSYLKKLGNTTEERVLALSEGIDLQSVRQYWYNLLENKRFELESELNRYEKEKSAFIIEVTTGFTAQSSFRYSPAIDRRTKETFAQTFEQIQTFRDNVSQVHDVEDLLNVLVGKKLTEIK